MFRSMRSVGIKHSFQVQGVSPLCSIIAVKRERAGGTRPGRRCGNDVPLSSRAQQADVKAQFSGLTGSRPQLSLVQHTGPLDLPERRPAGSPCHTVKAGRTGCEYAWTLIAHPVTLARCAQLGAGGWMHQICAGRAKIRDAERYDVVLVCDSGPGNEGMDRHLQDLVGRHRAISGPGGNVRFGNGWCIICVRSIRSQSPTANRRDQPQTVAMSSVKSTLVERLLRRDAALQTIQLTDALLNTPYSLDPD